VAYFTALSQHLLGRKTTKEGEKTLSQNNQFENKFEYGIF
jgi:hypothetical protein